MSHTPHELSELFPDAADKIHALKLDDAHFARLAEQHHTLNRAIHRAETDLEPTDDLHLEELKKQRLALLDEIAAILRANEASS
ncbi:MAG: YdcH family protein [Pseudomonadota bacterium]